MIAHAVAVALAGLNAVLAKISHRTALCALGLWRVPGRTVALTRDRVALGVPLAAALLLAALAKGPLGTALNAMGQCPASRTLASRVFVGALPGWVCVDALVAGEGVGR